MRAGQAGCRARTRAGILAQSKSSIPLRGSKAVRLTSFLAAATLRLPVRAEIPGGAGLRADRRRGRRRRRARRPCRAGDRRVRRARWAGELSRLNPCQIADADRSVSARVTGVVPEPVALARGLGHGRNPRHRTHVSCREWPPGQGAGAGTPGLRRRRHVPHVRPRRGDGPSAVAPASVPATGARRRGRGTGGGRRRSRRYSSFQRASAPANSRQRGRGELHGGGAALQVTGAGAGAGIGLGSGGWRAPVPGGVPEPGQEAAGVARAVPRGRAGSGVPPVLAAFCV